MRTPATTSTDEKFADRGHMILVILSCMVLGRGQSQGNIDFQLLKEKSSSEKVSNEYKNNTQIAYEFGIFGVPSFSVNENLFWGDDRLNDIIHFKEELNLV